MRKDEEGNECPATLGEYRDLCAALGGTGCRAVEFLDGRIASDPDGRDAEVIQADSQMRLLLMPMLIDPAKERPWEDIEGDGEGSQDDELTLVVANGQLSKGET